MHGSASGFFRTKTVDGVSWILDPEGAPFLSFGVNHVRWDGDHSPALGYAPYHRTVSAKYASQEEWADSALNRLESWGFNTIGTWSDPGFCCRDSAHVHILSIGTAAGAEWRKGVFPDVFSGRFHAAARAAAAKQCGPNRDNRHLLGYFSDNELRWGPDIRTSRSLFADYFTLPGESPGKNEVVLFLGDRYGSIEAFNAMWDAEYPDFNALLDVCDLDRACENFRRAGWESLMHTLIECCPPARILTYLHAWHAGIDALNAEWGSAFPSFEAALEPPPQTDLGRERAALESGFLRRVADAYFTECAAAIRAHDPNHMILGCRFAGAAFPEVVKSMGANADLVSYNNYSFEAPVERLRQLHEWTGKPVMLTEFSFKAMDSGLPNTHGAGIPVQTQQERADLYEGYVTALMKLPFAVGFHWFQYTDQPAEGRFDGENSNYGLVNLQDEPWETLTRRMETVNRGLYRIHANESG